MSEDLHTPTTAAPTPPEPAPSPVAQAAQTAERPEILAAGAFAGGVLAAMILKRLAR